MSVFFLLTFQLTIDLASNPKSLGDCWTCVTCNKHCYSNTIYMDTEMTGLYSAWFRSTIELWSEQLAFLCKHNFEFSSSLTDKILGYYILT